MLFVLNQTKNVADSWLQLLAAYERLAELWNSIVTGRRGVQESFELLRHQSKA
jgi:hypothetical protein